MGNSARQAAYLGIAPHTGGRPPCIRCCSPGAQERAGVRGEKLAAVREQVRAAGEEASVVSETVTLRDGNRSYVRRLKLTRAPGEFDMTWVLTADGKIAGFTLRPAEAPSRYADYQPKARYRLPFEGEWLVFWGGRMVAQNYHASVPNQRFAYDLVVVGADGATHRGDGKQLTDSLCWGLAILAPADGKVVTARDGLDDQAIGTMDPGHPEGNHVVIEHAPGEYSLLAHLQKGSVQVKPGDAVKAGQVLARCGNSGNTSEPHLHVQLMTTPALTRESDSLPLPFSSYLADGQPVARGEPVKGQHVRPQSAK